ncbi:MULTISPECIES: peptidase inhibitor family I36 protein [Streptomyces]|uniref:peptidase inhibitor family I36 protein n=1 Tax=Streptomyces TaxID=1883 RepID=UPI0006EB5FCB|nr:MULTISPECIES: peptidase inhibitor family I36 protein [Streptomyces]
MKKKLAISISAAALCLAMAPTAQATGDGGGSEVSVQAGECPSGSACFWPHSEFRGNRGQVEGDNANFATLRNSANSCGSRGWEDCISSIANNGRQCTVYFYSNRSYSKTSRWHSLSRGDKVGDFARDYSDAGFNDTISSNKWCSS